MCPNLGHIRYARRRSGLFFGISNCNNTQKFEVSVRFENRSTHIISEENICNRNYAVDHRWNMSRGSFVRRQISEREREEENK